MHKIVSDYLNDVCSQIRSRQVRLTVLAEFSGHIAEAVEEMKAQGMDEEEASKAVVGRMGNAREVGKKISGIKSPVVNMIALVAGVLILIASFMWMTSFSYLILLIDIRALIFVAALTLAFVLIGGLTRFNKRTALARAKTCAMYAGGIGAVAGIILTLSAIDDLSQIGLGLSFSITSLMYGLLFSALAGSVAYLLRPIDANEIRRIFDWDNLE